MSSPPACSNISTHATRRWCCCHERRSPRSRIPGQKEAGTFPWYSSFGTDFNYDFNVTIDVSVAPVMFNFRTFDELEAVGMGWLGDGSSEQPGYSMFLRDDNRVFHTYSMYARGTEALGGSYAFLDTTALGRQEEWEEPKGRVETRSARGPELRELNVGGQPELPGSRGKRFGTTSEQERTSRRSRRNPQPRPRPNVDGHDRRGRKARSRKE